MTDQDAEDASVAGSVSNASLLNAIEAEVQEQEAEAAAAVATAEDSSGDEELFVDHVDSLAAPVEDAPPSSMGDEEEPAAPADRTNTHEAQDDSPPERAALRRQTSAGEPEAVPAPPPPVLDEVGVLTDRDGSSASGTVSSQSATSALRESAPPVHLPPAAAGGGGADVGDTVSSSVSSNGDDQDPRSGPDDSDEEEEDGHPLPVLEDDDNHSRRAVTSPLEQALQHRVQVPDLGPVSELAQEARQHAQPPGRATSEPEPDSLAAQGWPDHSSRSSLAPLPEDPTAATPGPDPEYWEEQQAAERRPEPVQKIIVPARLPAAKQLSLYIQKRRFPALMEPCWDQFNDQLGTRLSLRVEMIPGERHSAAHRAQAVAAVPLALGRDGQGPILRALGSSVAVMMPRGSATNRFSEPNGPIKTTSLNTDNAMFELGGMQERLMALLRETVNTSNRRHRSGSASSAATAELAAITAPPVQLDELGHEFTWRLALLQGATFQLCYSMAMTLAEAVEEKLLLRLYATSDDLKRLQAQGSDREQPAAACTRQQALRLLQQTERQTGLQPQTQDDLEHLEAQVTSLCASIDRTVELLRGTQTGVCTETIGVLWLALQRHAVVVRAPGTSVIVGIVFNPVLRALANHESANPNTALSFNGNGECVLLLRRPLQVGETLTVDPDDCFFRHVASDFELPDRIERELKDSMASFFCGQAGLHKRELAAEIEQAVFPPASLSSGILGPLHRLSHDRLRHLLRVCLNHCTSAMDLAWGERVTHWYRVARHDHLAAIHQARPAQLRLGTGTSAADPLAPRRVKAEDCPTLGPGNSGGLAEGLLGFRIHLVFVEGLLKLLEQLTIPVALRLLDGSDGKGTEVALRARLHCVRLLLPCLDRISKSLFPTSTQRLVTATQLQTLGGPEAVARLEARGPFVLGTRLLFRLNAVCRALASWQSTTLAKKTSQELAWLMPEPDHTVPTTGALLALNLQQGLRNGAVSIRGRGSMGASLQIDNLHSLDSLVVERVLYNAQYLRHLCRSARHRRGSSHRRSRERQAAPAEALEHPSNGVAPVAAEQQPEPTGAIDQYPEQAPEPANGVVANGHKSSKSKRRSSKSKHHHRSSSSGGSGHRSKSSSKHRHRSSASAVAAAPDTEAPEPAPLAPEAPPQQNGSYRPSSRTTAATHHKRQGSSGGGGLFGLPALGSLSGGARFPGMSIGQRGLNTVKPVPVNTGNRSHGLHAQPSSAKTLKRLSGQGGHHSRPPRASTPVPAPDLARDERLAAPPAAPAANTLGADLSLTAPP